MAFKTLLINPQINRMQQVLLDKHFLSMVLKHIMVKNKQYLLGMYEKSMPNTLTLKEKLQFVHEAGLIT